MAPLRQNHTEIGSYEAVPINAVATAGIVNAMNETNDGVKYPHRAVLLIEDSRTDARLVATYLNSLPTPPSLTHCLSLADAQDLSTMAFDVILTDLNLPDSGGVATVTAVVAAFPGNPVIALTTDEARGVECIGAGAQDFLPKDEMNSKTLARAIEYAVLRTEQVNRAQYESSHDSLTGVLNRQAFHEGAESQLTHTGPEDGIFLLFADVDNFKEINDGYGHAAGDQVLREVAGRLREAVRTSDLVARWGGDEFTIFGRIHPDDFASLVDRIRGRHDSASRSPVRTIRTLRYPSASVSVRPCPRQGCPSSTNSSAPRT